MPTNREIFFKAAFLLPPVICGRQMRPFSLAHEYFLSYLKNPHVVGGIANKETLLTAILICTMSYVEIKKFLNEFPSHRFSMWFLSWRFRNLQIAQASFESYLSEHYDIPDHYEPENLDDSKDGKLASKPAGARVSYNGPWQYHFMHILCREYSMTKTEAWDTSITEARCLYDVWSESTGHDDTLVSVDIGAPLLEGEDK